MNQFEMAHQMITYVKAHHGNSTLSLHGVPNLFLSTESGGSEPVFEYRVWWFLTCF
jgi:hypothetical protein